VATPKSPVRLTPFAKALIALFLIGTVALSVKRWAPDLWRKIVPASKTKQNKPLARGKEKPITVCIVTWGGYAGGQYFNGGFAASTESRYYTEYGMLVEFKVNDDYKASRDGWKAGEYDLLWTTADSFPTEAGNMQEFQPKILFQSDWSRGGDAIVVRRGIETVNDLKGKKVAVAYGTPSHTFLLWLLDAAGIQRDEVSLVEVPSAIDAATTFKAGSVDAAVVWSPDDEACVQAVAGSRVLKSTREATHIIADVFYAKSEYIDNHINELKSLIAGWLRGAAEINTDPSARQRAVQIVAAGLSQPEDFISKAIGNVRLTTYGDNVNFFNLKGTYTGVKGEDLYTKMSRIYAEIGLAPANTPSWRLVTDLRPLSAVPELRGPGDAAEELPTFQTATASQASAPAFATKRVRITFPTGSAVLDENAKYIIDSSFADVAKAFAKNRIRIEGNTDSVGSRWRNIELSKARAQSVASYLTRQYGFDPNRFVIVGNGPDKPVADNRTEEGRAQNRRTDFELIE
jgi:NitT/TauT family transport system substrate-binding protein